MRNWLLSNTCYGTWLPGDRRGSVTSVRDLRPDDEPREVARLVADYNFIAIPVVDDEGDIVGVVTVDDAMDLVLPEEWRPRVPKVFR